MTYIYIYIHIYVYEEHIVLFTKILINYFKWFKDFKGNFGNFINVKHKKTLQVKYKSTILHKFLVVTFNQCFISHIDIYRAS